MENIINTIYNIRYLDELSSQKTIIHKVHPLPKVLVTIIYLITVLSFDKYNISGLLPYILYPVVVSILSDMPILKILKRTFIMLPFIIGIGMFNPLFDKRPFISILGISISFGWISFITLIIKCSLTVTAGLLLISTTRIENIAKALRKLKVPKLFVTQFLLIYRYIFVLLEEVGKVIKAYNLRASFKKGISIKNSGSILGQIMLKSFDRAGRIYNAMIFRGFDGDYIFGKDDKINISSMLYLFIWGTFFIVIRFINVSELIGRWLIK